MEIRLVSRRHVQWRLAPSDSVNVWWIQTAIDSTQEPVIVGPPCGEEGGVSSLLQYG